jgi:hypothetical protein
VKPTHDPLRFPWLDVAIWLWPLLVVLAVYGFRPLLWVLYV